MNITELFRRLSYGELSNLAIGSEGVGVIQEDAQPRLINYVNEALLRLHSKFLLRENILFFQQVENLTYYYMLKRYAVSALTVPPCPNTPYLYILDSTDEPYQDDLIKVMQVIDSDSRILPLNDTENEFSIYTPQPNLIQVPMPVAGRVMAVEYQARHPLLGYEDLCQEIDLPYVLEGALTAYVAYKVYSHMNGADNGAKAVEHMQLYESICADVLAQDTVSQTRVSTTSKFQTRGFV